MTIPKKNDYVVNKQGQLVPNIRSNLLMTTTIGQQRMYPRNMLLKSYKDESAKKQHRQAIKDAVADLNRRTVRSNDGDRVPSDKRDSSKISSKESQEEDKSAGLKFIQKFGLHEDVKH